MDHLVLEDGRRLDYRLVGPAEGPVVVFHPGSPMGCTPLRFLESAAAARSLRVLAMSRPGYGDSTPLPGRSVVNVVDDTRQVLQHLGIDEVALAGYSAGGSHALACAARLPGARAVLTVSSMAPVADDLDWLSGMGEANAAEWGAVLEGRDRRPMLEGTPEVFRHLTTDQFMAGMAAQLHEVDTQVLTGEVATDILASMQEAYRSGIEGSIDDAAALVGPWGFELSEIDVPATVWHGSDDHVVPLPHGEWLAQHLPSATAHLHQGEGHISLLVGRIGEMLDELTALGA